MRYCEYSARYYPPQTTAHWLRPSAYTVDSWYRSLYSRCAVGAPPCGQRVCVLERGGGRTERVEAASFAGLAEVQQRPSVGAIRELQAALAPIDATPLARSALDELGALRHALTGAAAPPAASSTAAAPAATAGGVRAMAATSRYTRCDLPPSATAVRLVNDTAHSVSVCYYDEQARWAAAAASVWAADP